MGKGTARAMAVDSSQMEGFMKILAIDTGGGSCSVALWEEGRELAFHEKTSERDQASFLPELVRKIMGQHKVDQVIVNVGPGSFTGIRVGLAFAKGLTLGLGLPLKGIDSFTAIYSGLSSPKDVLILIDARRPDVFGRRFLEGIPQLLQSYGRGNVEKILLSSSPPLLAGSGVHALFKSSHPHEIFSPWRGAQNLAHAFFQNPALATEPFPFYAREANVTFSSHSCLSPL
mgnify:CR=1 FL=1